MSDRTAADWKQTDGRQTYYVSMALVAVLLSALLALPLVVPVQADRLFLAEGGLVQVLSAGFYLVIVICIIRETTWRFVTERWYFAFLPLAMLLRELDFHAQFTTMTITKLSFYVSPDVPLGEKLFGVSVFLVLAAAGVALLRNHRHAFFAGLRRLDPAVVALTLSLGCIVASKTLDGAARKLGDWNILMSSTAEGWAVMSEEILELGVPLYMMIAAFAYLGSVGLHQTEMRA